MKSPDRGKDLSNPDPILCRKRAAEYLGSISVKTLANWKSSGRYDLPVVLIGRRVFYRRSDLDAFIERGKQRPGTSRAGERT